MGWPTDISRLASFSQVTLDKEVQKIGRERSRPCVSATVQAEPS